MPSKYTALIIAIAVIAPLGYGFAGGEPGPLKPPAKHPNLVAATISLENAYEKITAAQKANEYDMDGHAAKAKEAISLARDELRLAAAAADKHGHRWRSVENRRACHATTPATCLPEQKPDRACSRVGDSCVVRCGEDLVCE